MARCKGTKKDGGKCMAPAVRAGLCYIHSDPGKAAEMSQKSADRRRKDAEAAKSEAVELLATPQTPFEVNAVLRAALADVRNGKLDVDTARVMSNLGATIFKGFEVSSIADRLAEIQRQLADPPRRGGKDGVI
jgi:hypothetical protein